MPPFKPAPPNIFQHDRHCQLSDMPRVPWRVGCCVCVVMPVVWYVRGKKNMPRVLWRVGCCVCVWSCQPCGMGKKKKHAACALASRVLCVCVVMPVVWSGEKNNNMPVYTAWYWNGGRSRGVMWCRVARVGGVSLVSIRQRRPEFKPFRTRERPAPSQPPRIQTVSNS